MPKGLEDIKATLARITRGDSVLDYLIEFERTLDAAEVFAYKNWLCGELLQGPEMDRYWFTTWWMYPEKLMPDPEAALRLQKIGCKVSYAKDTLLQPRKILTRADWADPKTKKAIIDEMPVWVIKIAMPMKYVIESLDDIHDTIDQIVNDTQEALEQTMPEPEPEMGMEPEAEPEM